MAGQPTLAPDPFGNSADINSSFMMPTNAGGGGLGGFLKNNLSTIGSIGLPLLGAALAPETGGLSLAALAGLGGGTGKVFQNLSQGKGTGSAGSILGAAGQGVAGDLTGQVLGAGLKLAGGIPSSLIAKGAAKASDTTATKAALIDEAPFQGVPTNIRQDTNMKDLISHVKSFGGTPNPETMGAMANLNTGTNGVVSNANRQILDTLPAIDTNPAIAAAKQALSLEGGPLSEVGTQSTKANGILNSLRRSIQTTGTPGSEGGITNASIKSAGGPVQTGMVDANSVFSNIQQLENRAKALNATGTYEGTAEARATTAAANALKEQLSKSGVDDAVANSYVGPETINAIHGTAAATGVPSAYAEHLVNGMNNAKTFDQMRALQEPAVRMSQLSEAANTAAGGALTKAPNSGGFGNLSTVYEAGSAAHGNAAALIPLGAKAATAPVVGPSLIKADKLIQGIRGLNTFNGNMPGALTAGKILSRVAGQNLAGTGKGNAAAAPTTAPDMNVAGAGATNTPTATPQDQNMQAQAPAFGQDQMLAAIAADPKNASTYISLYNAVGKPAEALTTNQKNAITGSQKAQSVLGSYQGQLNSVGGGKGPIGGNVENLIGSVINGGNASAAHALETQRQDVAVSVAGALTPTGRPAQNLIDQIANSLPTIKDTASTAQFKFQQLMQRIKDGEFSANQPIGTTSVAGS